MALFLGTMIFKKIITKKERLIQPFYCNTDLSTVITGLTPFNAPFTYLLFMNFERTKATKRTAFQKMSVLFTFLSFDSI